MAYLINRTPAARIICLHFLMKFICDKFTIHDEFRMGDLLFERDSLNIHAYCTLLKVNKDLDLQYCPFLENELSDAGCYLTKGLLSDTTKRKEISNTVNSLDALGFLKRTNNNLQITESGFVFANTEYESEQMLTLIRQAVTKYGVCVGLLYKIKQLGIEKFSTNQIDIGYPETDEHISEFGQLIKISSGAQQDTKTRTKSCILAWFVTAGFIIPDDMIDNVRVNYAHVDSLPYILSSTRNKRNFTIFKFPNNIMKNNFTTLNPLDYNNLTKNIGALRENGISLSRKVSMRFDNIIKNRRFAIIYLLNKTYEKNKKISLNQLINFLLDKEDLFVIQRNSFVNVIESELEIAFLSGIPYVIETGVIIKPLIGINVNILKENAPVELIEYLDTFNLGN